MKRLIFIILFSLCISSPCLANNFFGPRKVDSYALTNGDSDEHYLEDGCEIIGQSFHGLGLPVSVVYAKVKKSAVFTGSVYAKIYLEAHTTAFGTDSVGTGSALATSAAVAVADIGTDYAVVMFRFAAAYTPASGTDYILALTCADVTGTNYIYWQADTSSQSHAGNACYYTSSWGWGALADYDACFVMY